MVGYGFTILSETPCADPHAGCCGGWGLETPGYPIMCVYVMKVLGLSVCSQMIRHEVVVKFQF